MFEDSHSIQNRCKTHLCQLRNVHGVKEFNETKTHTVESAVHKPRVTEVEINTEKQKVCKSLGTDTNPTEVVQLLGKTVFSEKHKIIFQFVIRKNCLNSDISVL